MHQCRTKFDSRFQGFIIKKIIYINYNKINLFVIKRQDLPHQGMGYLKEITEFLLT